MQQRDGYALAEATILVPNEWIAVMPREVLDLIVYMALEDIATGNMHIWVDLAGVSANLKRLPDGQGFIFEKAPLPAFLVNLQS